MVDEIWIIDIGGYGSFVFRGNEADCDHMRSGKAEWEGAVGRKWTAEDGLRDPKLASKTARALLQAVKYPNSVADHRNYGRAPKRESTHE